MSISKGQVVILLLGVLDKNYIMVPSIPLQILFVIGTYYTYGLLLNNQLPRGRGFGPTEQISVWP